MKPEKKYLHVFYQADWSFLIFLLGITNVKLYIKTLTFCLYCLYLAYKKIPLPSKIPTVVWFYILMPLLGLISPLLHMQSAGGTYWLGYALGTYQWLLGGGTFFIIYTTVINGKRNKIAAAIEAFFILNFLVSGLQVMGAMVASHSLMPYWVDDLARKFGASTGDNILGLTGNSSVANATISILGVIYFLYINKPRLVFLCLVTMLLCTSNLSLFFAIILLGFVFLFSRTWKMRIRAISWIVFSVLFYIFLTPDNLRYISKTYKSITFLPKTESVTPPPARTIKARRFFFSEEAPKINRIEQYKLYVDSLSGNKYLFLLRNFKFSSDAAQRPNSNTLLDIGQVNNFFYKIYGVNPSETPLASEHLPGKIYTMKQTADFLKRNKQHLFFGAGMGCFSSKLAIKTTGLGIQGQYNPGYVYASNDFIAYHLYSILFYFSQDVSRHSVINFPNSVYNQIAGEYGILGILAFVILYLGYFFVKAKPNSYGKYLLLALCMFFGFEYWFEMISLTVIFELLILLDIFTPNKNAGAISNSSNAGV